MEVGEKDHLINAAKYLSNKTEERTIFLHTGWREVNGVWRYLHPSLEDVDVELPKELDRWRLPAAAGPEECKTAIRAAFDLRKISPANPLIGVVALAAPYLAAFGITPDFVIALTGASGTGKSAVAAATQNFFASGAPFKFDHLPANWGKFTEFAIIEMMFKIKDAILVVDEFKSNKGDRSEQARANKKFSSVVSAVADNAPLGRSDPKHQLHVSECPRGLLIATAEEVVTQGGGTVGRIYLVRHRPGDIDLCTAEAMHNTEALLYPVAMRSFVDWFGRQYVALQAAARAGFVEHRQRVCATSDLHPRTAANIGKLFTALKIATDHALDEHALTDSEVREMLAEAWQALTTGGVEEQAAVQRGTNEVDVFFERIRSAINTGNRAHLTDLSNGPPMFLRAKSKDDYSGMVGWSYSTGDLRPAGQSMGFMWLENNGHIQIGLDPNIAYGVATAMDPAHPLIPLAELSRRLVEPGVWLSTRNTTARRLTIASALGKS